jgi:hypothetical protein
LHHTKEKGIRERDREEEKEVNEWLRERKEIKERGREGRGDRGRRWLTL